MMNKVSFVIISLLFCLSCNENRELVQDFYADGSLKYETNIINGKKNGITVHYYSNGIKKIQLNYYNDSIIGDVLTFYENGDSEYIINSTDWYAKYFARDGKTYMTGKLINNKREGEWAEYTRDGNRRVFLWNYKNDKKDGAYISFWYNGKVQLLGRYKNGTLDGNFVYFDLNGNIEKIQVWKADERFRSSDLINEINFKN